MSRIANLAAPSTFIFLATLLILYRIPIQGSVPSTTMVVISAGIVPILFWSLADRMSALIGLLAIGGFIIILFVWAFGTQIFYPAGHDGYAYHLTAIWDIAQGWQPFHSPNNNIWVDSYPSGYWTLQACIVSITGLLLSGQALLIGMMAALALQAYSFFLEHISPSLSHLQIFSAVMFAVIVVANPILLTQIQTHYVDAPLYLVGTSLAFFLISDAASPNRFAMSGAISCIILLINVKTSALYFAPCILFGGFVIALYMAKNDTGLPRHILRWLGRRGILYGIVGLFGIFVIGYKPYVTNVLDHGEFLYPASAEIMDENTPANVQGAIPSPVKFLIGILAKSEHNRYDIPVEAPINLKIPGTFSLDELKALDFDIRRGGFGPFFSLALLASLLAYAASRAAIHGKQLNTTQRVGNGIAYFGFILLIMSALFPEPWWARYVPFLWLSPIFLTSSVLLFEPSGKRLTFTRLMVVIAVLSLLGCVLAGTLGAARQHIQTYQRFEPLERMKSAPFVELVLIEEVRRFSDYQSKSQTDAVAVYAAILNEKGISTQVTDHFDEERCVESGYFFGSVLWCIPKD